MELSLTHVFKFFLIWQRKDRCFSNTSTNTYGNVSHLLKTSFLCIVVKKVVKDFWHGKYIYCVILSVYIYTFIKLRHQGETI